MDTLDRLESVIIDGTTYTKAEFNKLTKQQLVDIAVKNKVTVDTSANKLSIQLAIINFIIANPVDGVDEVVVSPIETINIDTKTSSETDLKNRVKDIITKAHELNTLIKQHIADGTLETFKESLKEQGLYDYVGKLFDNLDGVKTPEEYDDVIVDLPLSDIITNIPIRVISQQVVETTMQYPLMERVDKQTVRNGVKQWFYKDYRDTDNASGFDDVTISDYNLGREPIFSEVKQVDTEIHKGYDILSTVLNDITLTMGAFIALVNDVIIAIARPFAKKMYARFITFLDQDSNYDEVLTFAGKTTTDKAKEVSVHLTGLSTPSRNNLKVKPNGAAQALEYSTTGKKIYLIMNNKYAANYKYDLTSQLFTLGEVTLEVSGIQTLDFDKLAEYSEIANGTLKDKQVIILEDKVYFEIVHYSASKVVDTPKLKTVMHRYDRIGNGRRKDKYLGAFK